MKVATLRYFMSYEVSVATPMFEFTNVKWSENNDNNIGRMGLSSHMLCGQKTMTTTLGELV